MKRFCEILEEVLEGTVIILLAVVGACLPLALYIIFRQAWLLLLLLPALPISITVVFYLYEKWMEGKR